MTWSIFEHLHLIRLTYLEAVPLLLQIDPTHNVTN